MPRERTVVAVVPPGVPLPAAGNVLSGMGACYPTDALTMTNSADGGFLIIYTPTGPDACEGDRAAGTPGNVSVSTGTASDEDYTVADADLFTFALTADGEDEAAGVVAMAEWLRRQLDKAGAANYLAHTLTLPDGDRYALTIQRVGGLTPAEKIAALQNEIQALAARLGDEPSRDA